MSETRIYSALILNDYPGRPYAEWVKTQKKTIETRMGRQFNYRGDLVICCGATNSVGKNAGKALCIVDLYDARPMIEEDVKAACIEWDADRRVHLLRNWRYFSYEFAFKDYKVSGPYQGIFKIRIPDFVEILSTGGH
jgi:hypothetical protein